MIDDILKFLNLAEFFATSWGERKKERVRERKEEEIRSRMREEEKGEEGGRKERSTKGRIFFSLIIKKHIVFHMFVPWK